MVDVFDRDRSPVSTVEPGTPLRVRTLDASGSLQPQTVPGEEVPLAIRGRRGHCLVGPIEVRGARVGQFLGVHLESLRPDPWGWTVAGGRDTPIARRLGLTDAAPSWLLWDVDNDTGTATDQHGHRVRIAPFLGITGVAPAEPGEHSTIPPRSGVGGNIDCRDLVAGSTLYLPVAVEGALLYLGDGHAAQGDGEVGGTALECGMTTELTLELHDTAPVPGVHAVTPSSRITFGFDADLNAATGDALDAMLTWMQLLFDLDRGTALALASVSVDLRITQVANQTWGVHAVLPHAVLPHAGLPHAGLPHAGLPRAGLPQPAR